MPDLRNLETKLGKDKSYSRASGFTDKERSMGFVCPRADAYGARDGVIPPGVAAVRGLVPKGMRHIKPGDVARHANEARDEGRTDVEQYREYYGRAAAEQEREAVPAVPAVPPVPAVQAPAVRAAPPILPPRPARAPAAVAAQGARVTGAEPPILPPAPNKNGRRKAKAQAARPADSGFPPKLPVAPPVPRRPPAEECVPQDPDDPGMFSRAQGPYPVDDTLDGFYEELRGLPRGTGEAGSEAIEPRGFAGGEAAGRGSVSAKGGRGAAVPAESPTHGSSSQAPAPRDAMGRMKFPSSAPDNPEPPVQADPVAAALASLVAERDQLARQVADLNEAVQAYHWRLTEYEERDKHYANIENELAAEREARKSAEAARPPLAETVRVILSSEEERLKIGGRGWESNIVGAVHRGRSERSLVLTISDPAYASELFAEIQPGDVVILSAGGRTSCTYSGRCAKIYGDAGSPDFIAVLWLDLPAVTE